MTEMAQGLSQGMDVPSSQAAAVESAPQQAPVEDRVFRQQEVNDIVKREKHAAIESFKKMALEQPQYLAQKHPDIAPFVQSQNQQSQLQTPSNFTPKDIAQIAAEEIQKQRDIWLQDAHRNVQEQEAKRIATDFFTKIDAGKSRYENFDKVMETIDLSQFPNAVQLANNFDNTADIWYHLIEDPIKLEAINSLATKSPKAAYAHLERLSKTLKDNENAQNVKFPNAPLSQLRPSNTGTSTGALSVSDLRRKYRA